MPSAYLQTVSKASLSLNSDRTGRFAGQDFALQPDGTLRCPTDQKLIPHEHRREADGSLRIVYGASIRSCRPCPKREQCQWLGSNTSKPRCSVFHSTRYFFIGVSLSRCCVSLKNIHPKALQEELAAPRDGQRFSSSRTVRSRMFSRFRSFDGRLEKFLAVLADPAFHWQRSRNA